MWGVQDKLRYKSLHLTLTLEMLLESNLYHGQTHTILTHNTDATINQLQLLLLLLLKLGGYRETNEPRKNVMDKNIKSFFYFNFRYGYKCILDWLNAWVHNDHTQNEAQLVRNTIAWEARPVAPCFELPSVRKMDPRPIYFGFWCLMINTTKLD